ncbi:unnamed protein product [Phaedon cochleariae]|uniref:DUF4806 domain-containing protein n=1 Tax=Phaedon cochleariae TaxID=80249 RepID=A0A9N9SG60_PHACE|nr:unnamed protein product [Phaedon cochleariae]
MSRNIASVNILQLERPGNSHNLPVSNKQEYKALERFLNKELSFEYNMKKRFAAIGGASVRNTVMGMLKFLLRNEVAMKFNWAGSDKRPFKTTNMMKVIKEAAIYSYRGRDDQDLTDEVIEESVKDWLKLAKARYGYSSNRKHK